jgi:hypothetical protein
MTDKPLTDEQIWGDPVASSRCEGQSELEAGRCPLSGIACGAWHVGCHIGPCGMDDREVKDENLIRKDSS